MRYIKSADIKKDTVNIVKFHFDGKDTPTIVRVSPGMLKNGRFETIIDGDTYIIYTNSIHKPVDVNHWTIHYVNGMEDPCLANIHTHFPEDMDHMDLQIILHLDPKTAGGILNALGTMIANGSEFHAGDVTEGILAQRPVCFKLFYETGRMVLRVILPDPDNKFPWNKGCDPLYKKQMLEIPT